VGHITIYSDLISGTDTPQLWIEAPNGSSQEPRMLDKLQDAAFILYFRGGHPHILSLRKTMTFLKRLAQRLLVFGLGIFCVWFCVFVVFDTADGRLPWILAVGVTYGVAAYIVLPRAIRVGLKILQRKRVPSYTITGDGLPGDPVNVALVGTLQQLRAAFTALGWSEADRLNLTSSWGMIRAFLLNTSYPSAPFSTLYLFGRGQDIGFQQAINNSPRKRHHVRFWALNPASAQETWGTARFWLGAERPPGDERVLWIGAGTRDTGLSLTRLSFQVTHATDSDTNAERDFIVGELKKNRSIEVVRSYRAGENLQTERVNHYVTDGEITLAVLVADGDENQDHGAPGAPNRPSP
jgi:hypothetical protein